MGVPGYFAAARRACPAAVVSDGRCSSPLPAFQDLYVDFNCVVHTAVSSPDASDGEVIEAAVVALRDIVRQVTPAGKVYVCTDGVPPEAKVAQQRGRRFMAAVRARSSGGDLAPPGFDRNKITPGTDFMRKLDQRMAAEAREDPRMVYSGSDVPGEGEQKITAAIRSSGTVPEGTEGAEGAEGAEAAEAAAPSCIYGMDADLVLLCAALLAQGHPCPWICREEAPREAGGGNDIVFVDTRRLAAACAGGDSPQALLNHVVCTFLCGNDFLPPLSCLDVSREAGWLPRLRGLCAAHELQLVVASSSSSSSSSPGLDLNWPHLADLLRLVAINEDHDFRVADREYWAARAPVSRSPEDEWNNLPLLRRDEGARCIRPGEPDWRSRYYARLFGMRDPAGINRVLGDYVRGLAWTLRYYLGDFPPPAPAPAWHYRHPYGPSSLDVYNYVVASSGQVPDAARLDHLPRPDTSPGTLLRFVTPAASAAAVLPAATMGPDEGPCCDPRALRPDLFPTDAALCTYLRRKIWHCAPALPRGVPADLDSPSPPLPCS